MCRMKHAIAIFLFCISMSAQQHPRPSQLAHTFSIVARDPQTGDMGVAVQSHWFSVGSSVTWAEAGVGAVATQSFVDPSYGPKGLELMRGGMSAGKALVTLTQADKNSDVRQLGFVDASGHSACFTGRKDIAAAGHKAGLMKGPRQEDAPTTQLAGGRVDFGEAYCVQANLMSNDGIWPAMDKAFVAAKGDLADRMLAALDAAQAAGGDIRGRQSAAIIVVKAKSSGKPWNDRIFDLRVEDNPYPLKELRRLVALQRAYNHMNAGDEATEQKDNEGALREYAAAEQIASQTADVPQSRLAEMVYWHAVALVNMGKVDESLPLFKKAFGLEAGWRTLTPRLPKSGLLPDDAKLIQRITAQ